MRKFFAAAGLLLALAGSTNVARADTPAQASASPKPHLAVVAEAKALSHEQKLQAQGAACIGRWKKEVKEKLDANGRVIERTTTMTCDGINTNPNKS